MNARAQQLVELCRDAPLLPVMIYNNKVKIIVTFLIFSPRAFIFIDFNVARVRSARASGRVCSDN